MSSLFGTASETDAKGGVRARSEPTGGTSTVRRSATMFAWLLVLLAAIPVFALALVVDGFQSPHSFDSAVILMEARSFAAAGILRLHGLPVIDNPPLLAVPHYYADWPPLVPIMLSRFILFFGDGIRGPQILIASVSLAMAFMLLRLLRRGPGIAAAATFLLAPWTMSYGFHVSMLIIGMLFGFAACCAWIAWRDACRSGKPKTAPLLIGCALLFLALFSSWDPFFLLPGLLAASLLTGEFRQSWRGLAAYAVSAILSVGVTFTLYASRQSGLFAEVGRKLWYRAGLGSYTPPFSPYWLVNDQGDFHPGLRGYVTCAIEFFRHAVLLGPAGLAALPFALLIVLRFRREEPFRRPIHLLVPLLSMWLGWSAVFAQQAMLHDYQTGAGVIAAAASVGVVWIFLQGRHGPALGLPPPLIAAGFGLVLIFGAAPAMDDRMREIGRGLPEAALGKLVAQSVEPGALVLTTERSAITAYFSGRHMIRGVPDETVMLDHVNAFRELCPDCPRYLAVRSGERTRFSQLIADGKPIQAGGDWEVYKLDQPRQPSALQ